MANRPPTMPVDNTSNRIDQFRRAEEIFHAVREAGTSGQERMIAEACAGDEELAREVRELLAAKEDAARASEQSPGRIGADAPAGRSLGPYRIERLLGRGGMGAVYLAHRADGQFEQTVAIKVIGLPFAFEVFRDRFVRERQILAALNHPNITRLLDGGVTADGELYLVMEYVEGDRLDVYCRRRDLPLPDRLRLFRAVCAAVQHAHQNLIVHRDIKPSNILVTAEGTPKLLDFGTAKLLAEQPGADEITSTGLGMMTPGYASPEQLRGQPVTTLSDVYSLGVVLFELLTGKKLFGPGIATLDPDRQTERPSAAARRANDARLARLLVGDLDRIVSKALQPETTQRYSSVEQFSDDVRRYLAGEPVLAHAPSMVYTGSKFIRRHIWGAALTVLFVMSLAAATAFSLWQARVARQQADRAQRINAFLNEMLGSPNPRWYNPLRNKGRSVTVMDVLDELRGRIGVELAGQPATEIELRRTIGRMYTTLGRHDRAHEQLEAALTRQLALTGPNHPDVGRTYNDLATDDYLAFNLVRGEQDARAAVSILRNARTRADRETLMEASQTLADILSNLGGAPGEPVILFQQALAISRELYGNGGSTPVLLADLGVFLIYSDMESALRDLDESLALFRAKPGGLPVEAFVALDGLGRLRMMSADYTGAEAFFREGYGVTQRALGPESPYTSTMREALALAIGLSGHFSEAEEELNACLKLRRQGKGSHSELSTTGAWRYLGEVQLAAGRLDSAEKNLRAVLSVYRRDIKKGDRRIAYTAGKLGECLLAEGKREEALPLLKESYAGLVATCGPKHPYTIRALERLRNAT
jgi:serine/threonine protein kinase